MSTQSAGQSAVRGRYVPGEIIVKLRTQDTGESAWEIERDKVRIVKGLGAHRVHEVRPLVRNLAVRRGRSLGSDRDRWSRPAAERRRLSRSLRGQGAASQPDARRIYRIRTDALDDADAEELLVALRSLPGVEYAERSHIISACAEPNDPLYHSQWALAQIKAVEAWEMSRGSADVVIALPDTGVDYNHRDLQGNLWINEAELNGVSGVDDDGNGYVDDVRGYDFIAPDADPLDDGGHGTHCAGVIAARGDNGLDIAGVCWQARIMPVKMLDEDGIGTSGEAVEAIYYAVDNGANVISCSWGDIEDSRALRDAVAYAHSEGVVLIAAAGNDHSSVPFYPAGYAEVIGVAATDRNDRRQYASSFGNWVDVAAPGDDILSLRAAGTSAGAAWDSFSTRLSGTSMAAPHVSGTCALLLCANPFLSPDEIRQRTLATGDPIQEGTCLSNARVNVAAALQAAVPWRGEVGLGRSAYPQGADILIHLADKHLEGAGTHAVLVTTNGGDTETVTLCEESASPGVFAAVLASAAGNTMPNDGCIQAQDGQWVAVEYLDVDNGEGRTNEIVRSEARFDYEPPAATRVNIEPRGTSVRLTVTTSEPARVRVSYGQPGEHDSWWSVHDLGFKSPHRLNFGPLSRELDYGLTITLTDAAGNETVIDRDELGQMYSVRVDPDVLLVPEMFRTIQDAVDAAQAGQTIWVADGTYSGSGNRAIDFEGKAIALRSENGPEACTINLRRRYYAFVFRNGEGNDTILDGFTITDGGRTDFGAGIQCLGGAPTIVNCVLSGNSARRLGGGIYCSMSNPTIQACTFIGNAADERGGGLYCDDGSSPIVIGCTFAENWADVGGAAGSAGQNGTTFTQCLFYDNTAASSGAAIAGFAGTVSLANCTIALNEAGQSGGGLWSSAAGSLRLNNCILWDNTVSRGAASVESMQVAADSTQVEADYCCVQGWTGTFAGIGSFGLDPLFSDPENGDFHLRSEGGRWAPRQSEWVYDTVTSPCIDAGDPDWPLGDELLMLPDESANAQPVNTHVNLGAYGGTAQASLALRR